MSLSTHVLDTARGCPAADLAFELRALDADREILFRGVTNNDGRCPEMTEAMGRLVPGHYELVFYAGPYLHNHFDVPEPPFLDRIPIAFGISSRNEHYHVPLLLSPFGYSTYRGS